MSAFKSLRDVSNNFENDLRQVSTELFSARIGNTFEDTVEKKLKDLALFSSKLKLLQAKPLSSTPQVTQSLNETALVEYGDTAVWKVIEQLTAKSVVQSHAVKTLITTTDSNLDAELIERKKAIIITLIQFRHKECELHLLNTLLCEKEKEHAAVRAEWDQTVGELRDIRERQEIHDDCNRGPLYEKLSRVVDKLELMRWLLGRLTCGRGTYDWLSDPASRRSILPLTRQHHSVDMFTT